MLFLLNRTDNYEFRKFREIKELNGDISLLVLGSSRARNHYNNEIIENLLNEKTYCIGSIGSFLDVNKMMLDYYLAYNTPPKYVLLDLSVYSFQRIDQVPFYAQYTGVLNEKIIYDFLYSKDPRTLVFRYIPLSGFIINRFALRESLESIPLLFSQNVYHSEHGFYPLNENFEGKRYDEFKNILLAGKETVDIDNNKIETLKEIINICKRREINLIFVYSPIYSGFLENIENKDFILNKFKEISSANGIRFFDYSNSHFCNDTKYFFDIDHMNKTGADAFTIELSLKLKETLIN